MNAEEFTPSDEQLEPESSEMLEQPDHSDQPGIAMLDSLLTKKLAQEAELNHKISILEQQLATLESQKQEFIANQLGELQSAIAHLSQQALLPLEQRRQDLQESVNLLQRKQERLNQEMRTIYAGASQEVAIRVQGFKDYLVGSLQDLVVSAEKLDLIPPPIIQEVAAPSPAQEPPLLATQTFSEYREQVEKTLDRYRTMPDYYGAPWKLRRTFENSHSQRISQWFFEQAGRGAIRSMGTRLQNILVAAAATSILRLIYGDRLRVLILATSPERLGEWRRGFQDCLGIGREQFGPEKGVVLFEDPEPLCFKGDRLIQEKAMPLVILDEAEELIAVDLLRFPLLLAFGRDPQAKSSFSSRDERGWDF
ncbi:MAG: DUF3086 domain-containing protein [Pseudanabaenaceae cyanobacterium bins.68]|nr:DUF3086 domain-containing protein [Pseudanabaenaceae cyanobacterium bins.68]